MEKKINERTFDFALEVVAIYKYLIGNKEYILSKQILRAGISTGANVEEAQAAQSKADFISKMSIASKEARETKYWLRLLSVIWVFRQLHEKSRYIQCSGFNNQHHNKNSKNIF